MQKRNNLTNLKGWKSEEVGEANQKITNGRTKQTRNAIGTEKGLKDTNIRKYM